METGSTGSVPTRCFAIHSLQVYQLPFPISLLTHLILPTITFIGNMQNKTVTIHNWLTYKQTKLHTTENTQLNKPKQLNTINTTS